MDFAPGWLVVLFGVIVSFYLLVLRVTNPIGHPWRKILRHAAPGVASALTLQFLIAILLFETIVTHPYAPVTMRGALVAFLTGLLPGALLNELARRPTHWRAVFMTRWVGAALNTVYDWTFRYLQKIISREDRLSHHRIMATYPAAAINKLFAMHKIAIARDVVRRVLRGAPATKAPNILKIRALELKAMYLLQSFGERGCTQSLDRLVVEPNCLLSTWTGVEHRQSSTRRFTQRSRNPERRNMIPFGQRDYDQPLIADFITGALGL